MSRSTLHILPLMPYLSSLAHRPVLNTLSYALVKSMKRTKAYSRLLRLRNRNELSRITQSSQPRFFLNAYCSSGRMFLDSTCFSSLPLSNSRYTLLRTEIIEIGLQFLSSVVFFF